MSKTVKNDNPAGEKKTGLNSKYRSWISTGVIIIVAFIFFIINNSGEEPENGPYPPNYTPTNTASLQQAPLFNLPTANGKILNLADYKGKVIILDFWATWCPPCRKGIPDLIELQKAYGDDIAVIGISVDQDSKPDVVPFIKNYGINYPVAYGNPAVYQQYGGIRSIPTSFIVNQEGKIFKKYVGLIPKDTYEKDINSLLDKS